MQLKSSVVLRLLLVAVCLLFLSVLPASATIEAFIPQRINGVPQSLPPYFSGTNCRFTWEVYCTPNTDPIQTVIVRVNGEAVDTWSRPPDIMVYPSLVGTVYF